jgi:2-C-methyl-D-erythritol 2,4-cyclodiphosphate synthase
MRIGFGNDIHRLEPGETLILGGIDVPSDRGAVGHSDGDALLHAVTDALLGALAAGDIGSHFPDTDERWKGAKSRVFVAEAARLVSEAGYAVSNVDATISLERPKLRPYIEQMRLGLAEMLSVPADRVSVKAKTGEGIGEIGNGLAVKAEAVVLLKKIQD